MMTPPRLVHATCVLVKGRGVLITGPSGVGKSDLALRLIDRSAVLVGDDYVEVCAKNGRLTAEVPERIKGKMEVRGVGLCSFPFQVSAMIDLIVRLGEAVERFPQQLIEEVEGISIPLLCLNAYEASAPIKVELALAQGIGIA